MNEIELKNYLLVYKSKEELVDMIYNARQYVKEHTIHDTPKYNGTRILERGFLIAKNDFWYEDLLEILGDKE